MVEDVWHKGVKQLGRTAGRLAKRNKGVAKMVFAASIIENVSSQSFRTGVLIGSINIAAEHTLK